MSVLFTIHATNRGFTMRYQVETYTLCDGWVNCWTDEDENPVIFATRGEAEQALKDLMRDLHYAFESGNIEDMGSIEDYQIKGVL